MIMREPLSCPCGPIISSIRRFDILSSFKFYYQYSTDDKYVIFLLKFKLYLFG